MNQIIREDMERITEDPFFQQLAGSRILITGATGLIGSLTVKACLRYNETHDTKISVIGMIRNRKKAEEVFEAALTNPHLELVEGDLRKPLEVPDDIDYILHTASVTTSKLFVDQPVETIETSYRGTKHVLELAKEKQCKGMVYLSSMEMYGRPDPSLERVTEEDLGYIDVLNVRSSYSEGKRISECLCAAYADEYKVPVRIARLAQTFGAGVLKSDNRVYAQFARSAVKGEDIVLHTEGKSNGNYCYTTDVIRALALLLCKGENGQAYNICNEETTTTIADMAKMVAEEFGGGKSKVVFDIPEDARTFGYAPDVKMHLDAGKLRGLGWKPEFGLSEMYARLIAGMEQ